MTLLLRWISPVELAFPARLHLILLPDFQAAAAARKGYFRYNVEGKVHTVYVRLNKATRSRTRRAPSGASRRLALRFRGYRAQLLRSLEREEQLARVKLILSGAP